MPLDENEFCNCLYGEIQSEGCCGRYVRISHRALEKKLPLLPTKASILEVGGNLGEHCSYVNHPYEKYVVSDYRKTGAKFTDSRIVFEQQDVEDLSYSDNSFDRVLMGCLLHHVNFPDTALREIRRVVKTDGLVSITLPCDPGLLYRIGKRIGPYRTLKRKEPKINPEYFHYLQHRNHYPALRSQIFEVFKNDEIKARAFPFNTRFWNSNLFSVFQIRVNKCRSE